ADERTLKVHFLNPVALTGSVSKASITGGEVIATIAVNPINDATDWATDPEGRPLLTLTVVAPGDFSPYVLTLSSPQLDPFYDHSSFSFKAGCPDRKSTRLNSSHVSIS